MRTKLFMLLAVLLIAASPIYAADNAGGTNWAAVTGGFAMAIASAGCGIAQSKALASACEGMARNPGAIAAIRGALILGLVFIESLALYTLIIIFRS